MRVTSEELHNWTRDLYNALIEPKSASFLDLLNSTLARQSNSQFRGTVEQVRDAVAQGHPLSVALSNHPEVFDADFVCIIRYGEIYGELDVVLERFLDHPEDRFPRCQIATPTS